MSVIKKSPETAPSSKSEKRQNQTNNKTVKHKKQTNNSTGPTADHFLNFQRRIGNQAVMRLIQSKGDSKNHSPGFKGTGAHSVMRKLAFDRVELSQPGDSDEREATLIANRVMRTQNGDRTMSPPLSRQSDEAVKPGSLSATNIHGKSLPESTRTFFESRLGEDLSAVRVHSDARAGEAAETMNAKAFTHGQDIYFARGLYAPHTSSGRHLLAHELAHTIQQRDGMKSVQREGEDEGLVHRPGQIGRIGNIRTIGPAITLDEDFTSSVTGHLNLRWSLLRGPPGSGSVEDTGRFVSGGLVHKWLLSGEQYTLQLTGTVEVRENNLILNDAYNGVAVNAEWYIRPRLEEGSSQDPALELIGVPEVNPMSNPLTPNRSDWNIVIKDISRSRSESAQAGLEIRWTKSGTRGSGYQGSAEMGDMGVSGGASQSVSLGDEGVAYTLLRSRFVSNFVERWD